MKIYIWKFPHKQHKQHMKLHDIDRNGRIIRLLIEENRKLKQKIFELEEELQRDFEEYIADDIDFIQVFHKKVKLEKNTPFGYED